MGMIFVPLFSIIMGEIEDHEVGSASGLLESFQQLGASLGVAALATLFFATIRLEDGGPVAAASAGRHVPWPPSTPAAVSLVLVAVAFAIGFLLPKKARDMGHDAPDTHSSAIAPWSRTLQVADEPVCGRVRGVE